MIIFLKDELKQKPVAIDLFELRPRVNGVEREARGVIPSEAKLLNGFYSNFVS